MVGQRFLPTVNQTRHPNCVEQSKTRWRRKDSAMGLPRRFIGRAPDGRSEACRETRYTLRPFPDLGLDESHRTEEVHFADVDSIVAKDRVGHHYMERNRYLQQIVFASDDFARRP